jgi:hypothetical protein
MKKVFYSALVVLALASCKKDYTCECTTVNTFNGNVGDPQTVTTIVKGVSKGQAASSSNCVSRETTEVDDNGDIFIESIECSISK